MTMFEAFCTLLGTVAGFLLLSLFVVGGMILLWKTVFYLVAL